MRRSPLSNTRALFPDEKHAYRNAGTDDPLMLFALVGTGESIEMENGLGTR
jgi:hypothetical protein